MTKLKLSYIKHIMKRHGSWEKTIMLGKQKVAGKRKTKYKMGDSNKAAIGMDLPQLSKAVEVRTL